jgi:Tripartite tricarboxylate transporter family receptor
MKLPRRTFLHLAAGAAVLPVLSRIALAQSYPARPVRFVHGFAAGGSGDIAARLIGQLLSDRLGQQFVVENRTGAGGNIAVETVARAPADGYTLLQLNVANTINTALYERLNFNLLNDIAPGRKLHARAQRHGGDTVAPGEDGSRVHRLRKSQSWKDFLCVLGCRLIDSHVGRIVQGDGQDRHAACALSRYRRGWPFRPDDWRGARGLRQPAELDRADTRRQAASSGGDDNGAFGAAAGRSNRGRFPARL